MLRTAGERVRPRHTLTFVCGAASLHATCALACGSPRTSPTRFRQRRSLPEVRPPATRPRGFAFVLDIRRVQVLRGRENHRPTGRAVPGSGVSSPIGPPVRPLPANVPGLAAIIGAFPGCAFDPASVISSAIGSSSPSSVVMLAVFSRGFAAFRGAFGMGAGFGLARELPRNAMFGSSCLAAGTKYSR